ncbi:MAG: drug resistance transporter, Bcr/CflA subfamily [Alphaproteobacteria bacterium]|jgi:Bcr/CflA subfamily drug resistance transporter|nr:drug resistance transporter, Bcr/CflA subfamily [Alphaproteobacteria bacterium]
MKQHHLLPATWLIILIVGIPILSETVYTPSLPDIAHTLSVSNSLVEYTLTIYLLGLAIGTLFWGNLSDQWGRKPCLVMGFVLYLFGCLGCYLSDTILWLMASRFIQAFGGSVGSVLGQAVCRDAFHGASLGRIYASVGGALAIFPAIGPIIGGVMDQHFGWPSIFLFLIGVGSLVVSLTVRFLPETHKAEHRERISLKDTFLKMTRDRQVIGFGLLVGLANGVSFSYYAEAPFLMIELLELSPSQYGLTFIGTAFATLCGGLGGRKLHDHWTSARILGYGLAITFLGSLLLMGVVWLCLDRVFLLWGNLFAMMVIMGGIPLITSNALSLALVHYKKCIGTASSLFGFSYYALVSLVTLGMGYGHNGTLFPMPIYFCGLSVFMILVNKTLLKEKA